MSPGQTHGYPTCAETYVTLCVYHQNLDPEAVTRLLNLQPSSCHRRGDVLDALGEQASHSRQARNGGWFLTSRGSIDSPDVRMHLDWLIDRLAGASGALSALREQDCETVVSCYWLSAHGHGGPMLAPDMMHQLSELGLELWFDIYFAVDECERASDPASERDG